jgi:hypothetical protein
MMIDYAQTEKNRKRRKKKIRMYAILIFLLLIGLAAGAEYLAHRPFLSVQEITVAVNPVSAQADTSAVVGAVDAFLDAHKSVLFGWRSFIVAQAETDSIAQAILADHPEWQSVEVNARYFSRSLVVTVTPRQRVGLWCDATQSCVWFDASCMAFAPGPQPEGALIPFVVDNQAHPVPIGSSIVDQGACKNLLNIFAFLDATHVAGALISFDAATTDITAHASGTPEFFFNLRTDPSFAVDPVLKKLSPFFDRVQYIDVRIPDRIYYKER